MFFWNFELPTLIIRIHLKHSFVFHLNSKGERELKDDHKHSCHWQGSWRSKRWLDQAYGALDNLYQGFHSPLNLYSEFCVYKYFLEEEVCGRYQKFMVPQIMHEWCSQVEGSWVQWVAIPFSRGSSQPRDQIWVSCIADRPFTIWAPGKPQVSVLISLQCLVSLASEAIWPRAFLLWGSWLLSECLLLLGLFRFPVYTWASFSSLYVSRNLLILSRLYNWLALIDWY